MPNLNIADLKTGETDELGVTILQFYGRKPPEYAIYRTRERITIQYADAEKLNAEQRKMMACLNPLRGQINGLIDGWRTNRRLRDRLVDWLNRGKNLPQKPSPLQRKAERYDRRVADALILGFENDVSSAQALLLQIKEDILNERVTQARNEYLLAALAVAFGPTAWLWWAATNTFTEEVMNLIRAASGGTLGAFFSIALAIRTRTVLPDLQRVGNLVDAALRIMIGFIAAGVLYALMRTGVVNLMLGEAKLLGDQHSWLYVLLIGFIAGFSERFVPDLLAKVGTSTDAQATDASLPPPPPTPGSAPDTAAAEVETPAEDVDDAQGVDAHADHCVSDIELADHEITTDAELPAASGGVAQPGAT